MKRLIQHARRIPLGFRYTRRGLLIQRGEVRLQDGANEEEIVGRVDPFDRPFDEMAKIRAAAEARGIDPDELRGWNGAGSDVDGRDLEIDRG